jgi:hypothetical protein
VGDGFWVIDLGELVKVVLKRGEWEKGWWVGERVGGLLGFVVLVCVWLYFCCCGGGSLFQGFQGTGIVYIWYSRLVSG